MGGRPKALLKLGGRRIIERVVDAVKPAVDDLLIVTNTPELYTFLGLPTVPDIYPDHGSLGGIYSGLLAPPGGGRSRSEEHTSELQSRSDLVCRLLLGTKKKLST